MLVKFTDVDNSPVLIKTESVAYVYSSDENNTIIVLALGGSTVRIPVINSIEEVKEAFENGHDAPDPEDKKEYAGKTESQKTPHYNVMVVFSKQKRMVDVVKSLVKHNVVKLDVDAIFAALSDLAGVKMGESFCVYRTTDTKAAEILKKDLNAIGQVTSFIVETN